MINLEINSYILVQETKNLFSLVLVSAALAGFFSWQHFPAAVGGAFIQHLPEYPVRLRQTAGNEWLNIVLLRGAILRQEGAGFTASSLDFPEVPEKQVIVPKFSGSASEITMIARAVLARDRESGSVLYEKNPQTVLPIASLTKLMTALVVSKKVSLDDIVVIEEADTKVPLYRAELLPGEEIIVRQLLRAMLVGSANDAATALARYAGPGIPEFVAEMNAEGRRLRMNSTSFSNPVGFDDSLHYSTAEDLARLVDEFLLYDDLVEITGIKEVNISSQDGKRSHQVATTNKLMLADPQVKGLKTGYTAEARGNLIILTDKYYSIILGSDKREDETAKLMSWIKNNFTWP